MLLLRARQRRISPQGVDAWLFFGEAQPKPDRVTTVAQIRSRAGQGSEYAAGQLRSTAKVRQDTATLITLVLPPNVTSTQRELKT